MKYFQVKVSFTVDVDGKLKKQNVNYLVKAVSVTDAEATITKYLKDQSENNFEVKSAVESNISAVI